MIMRTITTTVVNIKEAQVKGDNIKEVNLPPLELTGKASDKKIQRELKKKYPEKHVFILSVDVKNEKFKMTMEDFKKYGTRY